MPAVLPNAGHVSLGVFHARQSSQPAPAVGAGRGCALIGPTTALVAVGADLNPRSLPDVTLIGLPDAAVNECTERVQAAIFELNADPPAYTTDFMDIKGAVSSFAFTEEDKNHCHSSCHAWRREVSNLCVLYGVTPQSYQKTPAR
jgi:hypothetical protein